MDRRSFMKMIGGAVAGLTMTLPHKKKTNLLANLGECRSSGWIDNSNADTYYMIHRNGMPLTEVRRWPNREGC